MPRKTCKPRPSAPPPVVDDLDFGDGLFVVIVDPAQVAAREAELAERARVARVAADAYQSALNDTIDPVAARDAARRAAAIAQRGEG